MCFGSVNSFHSRPFEGNQNGTLNRLSGNETIQHQSSTEIRAWKSQPIAATIEVMLQLGLFAMHFLEVMFFVGLAGSSVVVLISFVEDAQELFGED